MKNKVIITGAGRGIGLETAKIFDNQNWEVIFWDNLLSSNFNISIKFLNDFVPD